MAPQRSMSEQVAAMTIAAAQFNGARSAKARSEFHARDLQHFKG